MAVARRAKIDGKTGEGTLMAEREIDGFKLSTQCGLAGDRWHATICMKRADGVGPSHIRGMGMFFERESAEAHAEKSLAEVIGVTNNWILLFPADME